MTDYDTLCAAQHNRSIEAAERAFDRAYDEAERDFFTKLAHEQLTTPLIDEKTTPLEAFFEEIECGDIYKEPPRRKMTELERKFREAEAKKHPFSHAEILNLIFELAAYNPDYKKLHEIAGKIIDRVADEFATNYAIEYSDRYEDDGE